MPVTDQIPVLSSSEVARGLQLAAASPRRRHAEILHRSGDEFNRAINFIMHDSYMQPHLHPGDEKIEKISLLEGKLVVLFFDNLGLITKVIQLEPGARTSISVPAFTWHTYIMLSDHVVSYETMMGAYDPASWKEFAKWAPNEGAPASFAYLQSLREAATLLL